jgi:ParB family chromosome partitioning protein
MGEKMSKKALGRGLSALIPQRAAANETGATLVDIARIAPNPYQPRTEFNQLQLKELADSIRDKGVVQPLLVRRKAEGYELIAGERRLRALKLIGMTQAPVIIKDVTDSQSLEISLVENIQREDLNPLAQAMAYQRLQQEFAYDHQKIAQLIGKDRATVVNFLRLLKLPEPIQQHLKAGRITMGHARAILGLAAASEQLNLCRRVLAQQLSVRQTEILAQRRAPRPRKTVRPKRDIHLEQVEAELRERLGTKVKIIPRGKGGRIVVEYYSPRDLERIMDKVKR